MKFRRVILCLAAVVMCFCGGCSQPGETQTAADIHEAWTQDSVNMLWDYIPADSAIFMASTHHFDSRNNLLAAVLGPWIRNLDAEFQDFWQAYKQEIQNQPEDGRDGELVVYERIKAEYDEILALLTNYEVHAGEWGLRADGHEDFVFYQNEERAVLKFTVGDVSRFKEKYRAVDWSRSAQEFVRGNIRVEDVQIQGEDWTIYDLKPDERECTKSVNENTGNDVPEELECRYRRAFAVHLGADRVVTVTMLKDESSQKLAECLKKAEQPMSLMTYAGLKKDVQVFGHSENERLMKIWGNDRRIDDAVNLVLEHGIREWLGKQYPQTDYFVRLDGRNVMLDFLLTPSDAVEFEKIKGMHVPMHGAGKDYVFSGRMALNIRKLLEMLGERKVTAENVPAGVQRYIRKVRDVFDAVPPEFQDIREIGMDVRKLEFGGDQIDFEGRIEAYSSSISAVVREIYDVLQSELVPKEGVEQAFGLEVPLNTPELMKSPVREIMTDERYAVVTQVYDISEQTELMTDNREFAEVRAVGAFIDTIYPRLKLKRAESFVCDLLPKFSHKDFCDGYLRRFLGINKEKVEYRLSIGTTEREMYLSIGLGIRD